MHKHLPGMTESAEIIPFNKCLGSVPRIIWCCTKECGPAIGFQSAPDNSDIPDIHDNLKKVRRCYDLHSFESSKSLNYYRKWIYKHRSFLPVIFLVVILLSINVFTNTCSIIWRMWTALRAHIVAGTCLRWSLWCG